METGRNERETRDATPPLILRLLQKLARAAPPPPGDEAPSNDSLPPPGQRSGQGTKSLAPYLDEYRNSRPGALE